MLEECAPVLTSETMMEVADETETLPADCVDQINDMEPKTETATAARGPAQPLIQPPDFTTTMYTGPTFREGKLSTSWAPRRNI